MRIILALATIAAIATPLVTLPDDTPTSTPPAKASRGQARATVTITRGVQVGVQVAPPPAQDTTSGVTRTRPCDGPPPCRLIVRDMP